MGSQISKNTIISASALTVALVALVIATAQLLGQYFATADGYRRCQVSMMGPWARHTRLKWRWSQFRFETLFTVPEIILLPLEAANADKHLPMPTQKGNLKWIASPETPTARCRTEEGLVLDLDEIDPLYLGWRQEKSDNFSIQKGSSEVACWLPFLQSLSYCEL